MSNKSLTNTLSDMRTELTSQVEDLRLRISSLSGQIEDLDDLDVPKSEFVARMRSWVDDQAKKLDMAYKLSPLRLVKSRPVDVMALRTPVRGSSRSMGEGEPVVAETDLGPLVCYIFGDVIKKRFEQTIRDMDYSEGLPADERSLKRQSLADELNRLELEEEALIMQAADIGQVIPRRDNCRPEIVLSIKLKDL